MGVCLNLSLECAVAGFESSAGGRAAGGRRGDRPRMTVVSGAR